MGIAFAGAAVVHLRDHSACPDARGDCYFGDEHCLPTLEAWEAMHVWREEVEARARFEADEDRHMQKHYDRYSSWLDDLSPEGTGES